MKVEEKSKGYLQEDEPELANNGEKEEEQRDGCCGNQRIFIVSTMAGARKGIKVRVVRERDRIQYQEGPSR